jgi:hypothetical protein
MLLLDAINYMLPKLGEHEVTTVDARHPTLAIILPEIEDQLRIVLNKGWWFNEYDLTLYPDSEQELNIGIDTISLVPYGEVVAVQRGRRMYNSETRSYKFTEPLDVRVKEYIPFEEVPENAAIWVRNEALCSVYIADIGMTADVQTWQVKAAVAQSDLLAEHLRNKKYTTKRSRRWAKFKGALKG